MGWFKKLLESKYIIHIVSEKGLNEIYELIVDSEIAHSEKYSRLYTIAKKAGQEELTRQSRGYIIDSIADLTSSRESAIKSGKITSKNLDGKIDEQIKKLRAVID